MAASVFPALARQRAWACNERAARSALVACPARRAKAAAASTGLLDPKPSALVHEASRASCLGAEAGLGYATLPAASKQITASARPARTCLAKSAGGAS